MVLNILVRMTLSDFVTVFEVKPFQRYDLGFSSSEFKARIEFYFFNIDIIQFLRRFEIVPLSTW